MSICLPCKGSSTDDGTMETTSSNSICVRCLTFWILVVLFGLGLLAHYHDSQGNVHF